MKARRIRLAHDDQGALLPMAIVMVLVFGAVAAALAAFGATSLRNTVVTRTATNLRASAEAGLRYQLERMLIDPVCIPSNQLPINPNGHNIAIACNFASGSAEGLSNWAVVITGNGATTSLPAFTSGGASSVTKRIQGAVYLGITSPAGAASALAKSVTIQDGSLYYYAADCTAATAPTVSNLTITPSPPQGKVCITQAWQSVVPVPTLPTIPAYSAGNEKGIETLPGFGSCRVFFPGEYRSPPEVQGRDTYFVSGDYYFNFTDTFIVKNADVKGGQPDPTLNDVGYLANLSPNCANILNDPTVASAENGYGVTLMLGAGAKISVDGNGRLELFSRPQGSDNVSIWAIEAGSGGYTPSTITMANGPVLAMKSGSNNDMVVHARIRAPQAQISFGNVSNSANAQVIGGLIAAGIDLQGSASATNFVIGSNTTPAVTKIVLTSTATNPSNGQTVTVQAVIDKRPNRSVTDAVTNGTTTVTSATAAFSAADVGRPVVGTGVAAGTTIAGVAGPTSITLSVPATSPGTSRTLIIQTPQVAINSWRRA